MALILVMGIPGSGKSTFCQKMKVSSLTTVDVMSFDEFLHEFRLQKHSAREMRKLFENEMRLRISSSDCKVCLIEDTFHLKSMRRPFLKIAKQLCIPVGVVFINLDVEEAVRRNSRRKGLEKQPDETIRKIYDSMEPPEEFDRVLEIVEDENSVYSIDDLVKRLNITILNVKSIEATHKQTQDNKKQNDNTSISQIFDVMTRRIVGDLIKSSNFSLAPKTLNEARKTVLRRIVIDNDVMIGGNDQDVREKLKEEILNEYGRSST